MREVVGDTVIIGGGLAGLMAAIVSSTYNKKIILVSKGYGESYMSSGLIHMHDSYPLLDKKIIKFAVKKFQEVLPQYKFLQRPFRFPTFLGKYTFANLIPNSTYKGALENTLEKTVIIPIFEKLDFNLYFLQNLYKQLNIKFKMRKIKIFECPCSWLDVALWMENKNFFTKFSKKFCSQINLSETEICALPSFFGLNKNIAKDFSKLVNFFEIPAPPPAILGMRLMNCLRKVAIQNKNIELIAGEVKKSILTQRRCDSIIVSRGNTKIKVYGNVFVLATGSFISGGLGFKEHFYEPIFKIRLQVNKPFSTKFKGPHEILSIGVPVDNSLKLKNIPNVICAGSIIDSKEVKDLGFALATGVYAGLKAGGI